ncbi:MAG: hypothetical protein GY746_01270, partial [Gammaproteobacteria bacterium]|nr:hypothetical protein [Gammaproteobacteria bacterium]
DVRVSGYGKNAVAKLYIDDALQYLLDYTARVAINKDVDSADAIDYVLDYIDYPARWGRDLEQNSDTISYFWASGNKSAMSVINEIVSSFLGYFFISNEGVAKYVARTNVDTIDLEYDQAELLKDIGNPQPYENNKNVTRIKAHPRTIAGTGVIWQLLGDVPAVQPGAANSLPVWANYTYNDAPVPAEGVLTPVATTDYTVNTQADGGGTDITADCTVSLSDFGDTAKLDIVNTNVAV